MWERREPRFPFQQKTRLAAGLLQSCCCESGSPGRIRTSECLSQSQVPYRLATGLLTGFYDVSA
jgi:hypothetical protein